MSSSVTSAIPAQQSGRAQAAATFRVGFRGGENGAPAAAEIAVPWLAGTSTEEIFGEGERIDASAGLQLHRCGGLLVGWARARFTPGELTARTEEVYARMLQACRGRHLFRVWNYVPAINDVSAGLENYRAFCVGRARAFERSFGPEFPTCLPAASAVGSSGGELELIFAAGEAAPAHFENPAQVPAYRYPPEHGPRSPSFARATVGRDGARRWVFISGTAAIRGHETVAAGSIAAQLECTLENLELIGAAAGVGSQLQPAEGGRRHFKIYLRHARDLAAVRARLDRALLRAGDEVIYLRADICRAELDVEIEATLVGPR